MDHFSSEDTGASEKEVYSVFQEKKSSVLPQIMSELRNADASVYHDLSEEMRAYMDYIYDTVLTANTGIILTGRIDSFGRNVYFLGHGRRRQSS